MNPLLYAKLGGALVIVALIFGSGWTTCKWRYEAHQAEQLKAVAQAYQSQVLAREASEKRLQEVTDAYDAVKSIPDPATVGLAHRVYVAAAGGCVVPQAPAVASGAQTPAALPGSAGPTEQALAAYIDSCAADAAQLSAVIQLGP